MKKILSYDTTTKSEVIPINKDLEKIIKESGVKDGTLIAYSLHTTLGLMIQESVEINLCADIIDQMTKIVEDDGTKYKHTCAKHPSGTCKHDDVNGPSHVRQMLTNQNILLDIEDSKLKLGRWQDVALVEWDGPRKGREILVKIIEDSNLSKI